MISFFYVWVRGLHREIKSAPCFNHRLVLNGPVYPPLKSEGAAIGNNYHLYYGAVKYVDASLSCKHIEAIRA